MISFHDEERGLASVSLSALSGAPQSISFGADKGDACKILTVCDDGKAVTCAVSCNTDEYEIGNSVESASVTDIGSSSVNVDWDSDGKFVRMCQMINGEHFLRYFEVGEDGSLKPASDASVRNCNWASWTSVIGWYIQGGSFFPFHIAFDYFIFSQFLCSGAWTDTDGTQDVVSMERSSDNKMSIIASSNGRLRLFGFPCASSKAPFNETVAHCSGISNAQFTANDELVITTGMHDCSIMQWRVEGI